MITTIRLIIIEDSAPDAHLLVRELQDAGYEVTWSRVQTASALQKALKRQPWDAVICDFTMPNFSGPEALQIVRETADDLPFIYVSGTLGEDLAIEAVRAGAHDYVPKGKLKRLAPALE